MTAEREMDARLEFDLADRMRRALRVSDLGVQDMAEYLGVARNTVSTWINGRIVPSHQTLRLWAIRTGMPLEWLETGKAPVTDDGGPGSYTTRDLNPEPADFLERLARRQEQAAVEAARAAQTSERIAS